MSSFGLHRPSVETSAPASGPLGPQFLFDAAMRFKAAARTPDRRSVDRRFALLLLSAWLVAIGIAATYAHFDAGAAAYSLPLWALAGGGFVAGLICWCAREHSRQAGCVRRHNDFQNDLLSRAFQDANTGLPNRAAIEMRIDQHIEPRIPISCLCIRIGGIRSANELHGPRGGDTLLRSVVRRVQGATPAEDFLGRLSGESLVVLVTRRHTAADLTALANDIVESLTKPHLVLESTLNATVSIGIASHPADAADREHLLAAAERAMIAAKHDGGNNHRFIADLHEPIDELHQILATRLERALLQDALHLHYQPIFTQGERMVAVETLARWHDNELGFISPAEFIPVAEATGLIVPLSNWVLREDCTQMVQWLRLGTTLERICINVSVKQIWRSDFVRTVEHTLQTTSLAPQHLELEVTESALASDFATVKEHLQALRRLGIRISIDDFGTGYSSLHRLRELEADVLKIDRSFVQGAGETPNGAAVVQSIVEMAHRLHLSVIAEGVETREQLQMLIRLGCEEVQGFLLARPQAPEALTAALRSAAANPTQPQLRLVPRTA